MRDAQEVVEQSNQQAASKNVSSRFGEEAQVPQVHLGQN
jgi:hypothetical protein